MILACMSRYRLPLLWAAIFAAFHLIVVGGMILESPQGGEGFAFAVAAYDWPLFVLCKIPAICGHAAYGSGNLFILTAGTLVYAVGGFLIVWAIGGVRALIGRDSR